MTTDRGLLALMMEPAKTVAYYSHCTLRGINISYREDSVLMVVKVKDRKGRPKVAFVGAHSVFDCWDMLHKALRGSGVRLQWKDDKYAK